MQLLLKSMESLQWIWIILIFPKAETWHKVIQWTILHQQLVCFFLWLPLGPIIHAELEHKHEFAEGKSATIWETLWKICVTASPGVIGVQWKERKDVRCESIIGSLKTCLLLRLPHSLACGQQHIHQKWEQLVRGEEQFALTFKTQH